MADLKPPDEIAREVRRWVDGLRREGAYSGKPAPYLAEEAARAGMVEALRWVVDNGCNYEPILDKLAELEKS